MSSPRADPAASVVTPEAVALGLEDATAGTRGVAAAIDLGIIGVAMAVVQIATILLGAGPAGADWVGATISLVLGFVLLVGYPVICETLWRGRTPGKAALGLRVVTVEGGPVAFRHAAVRAALGLLELRASLGVIALVASLLSRRGQRLGDHVAGTVVIRSGSRRRRAQPMTVMVPPGLQDYAKALDPAGLPAPTYDAVRQFLQRREQLTATARAALAQRLADRVAADLGQHRDARVGPEAFLTCVAARAQQRQAPVEKAPFS
jgi:uncharacterized RDD family membrane protein YckC